MRGRGELALLAEIRARATRAGQIGGIALRPGQYVFGWTRTTGGDALSVHFHEAATGALVGTTDAHRIAGHSPVESLHIWPPADKALIQIGRFGIPYELGEE